MLMLVSAGDAFLEGPVARGSGSWTVAPDVRLVDEVQGSAWRAARGSQVTEEVRGDWRCGTSDECRGLVGLQSEW